MATAIRLTGNVGSSWRLDCINPIGPTDAWVTLDTVTLTNASQFDFDPAPGSLRRLYRVVAVPQPRNPSGIRARFRVNSFEAQ